MPIISTTQADDQRLVQYRDLQGQSTDRLQRAHFIVEGRFCVQKLAQSRFAVQSAVVQQGRENEVAAWFPDATNVFVLSASEIRKLVGFDFHRGVLACGIRPDDLYIDGLLGTQLSLPIVMAACGVSDRDNLGSMIRTATALGVGHTIVDHRTVDPYSRRVIRTSMGTAFSQQIYHSRTPVQDLKTLAELGNFRTIATSLIADATPIADFSIDDRPMILIMGNESTGIDPAIQAMASDLVTIPMKMATDSMNVSVATAIFLYELSRLTELHFPQGR